VRRKVPAVNSEPRLARRHVETRGLSVLDRTAIAILLSSERIAGGLRDGELPEEALLWHK
jgi:hypothetical protein